MSPTHLSKRRVKGLCIVKTSHNTHWHSLQQSDLVSVWVKYQTVHWYFGKQTKTAGAWQCKAILFIVIWGNVVYCPCFKVKWSISWTYLLRFTYSFLQRCHSISRCYWNNSYLLLNSNTSNDDACARRLMYRLCCRRTFWVNTTLTEYCCICLCFPSELNVHTKGVEVSL